jgi:hypothetical protein
MLTGEAGRRQQEALRQQTEIAAANQRRSLAQMAFEKGQLDQAIATGGKRGRGRSLLTFFNTGGQATLG